jgi:hypothetical protein
LKSPSGRSNGGVRGDERVEKESGAMDVTAGAGALPTYMPPPHGLTGRRLALVSVRLWGVGANLCARHHPWEHWARVKNIYPILDKAP